MTYNDTQFATLSQYDQNFFYAVRTRTSGPGITFSAVEEIAAIHREATGSKIRPQARCSSCIVRVLRVVASYYFADKDERAALAAERAAKSHEVAAVEKKAAPKKKTVKTAKKAEK